MRRIFASTMGFPASSIPSALRSHGRTKREAIATTGAVQVVNDMVGRGVGPMDDVLGVARDGEAQRLAVFEGGCGEYARGDCDSVIRRLALKAHGKCAIDGHL